MNPRVCLHVGHQHSQFWPILVRFVHYYSAFWGPKAISTIDEPRVRLCVCRQHSQFCPILTSFVDYYSPFWGPEAISIVVEPQGVLTRWSSTLAVLADSGPFLRLLIFFGVSESFPRLTNPGVRLCVRRQHSQFWPILTCFVDYNSLFLGPEAIYIVVEPQGVLTRWSSTLAVLDDFGPFHGPLLTVLGSLSDFHY